jgi:hypothetical protein
MFAVAGGIILAFIFFAFLGEVDLSPSPKPPPQPIDRSPATRGERAFAVLAVAGACGLSLYWLVVGHTS